MRRFSVCFPSRGRTSRGYLFQRGAADGDVDDGAEQTLATEQPGDGRLANTSYSTINNQLRGFKPLALLTGY
ncbi:hypothetical protein L6452_45213 [Arctium lappa]|nr:hypothetical protein L6452_45213 [Arctium lappa]